jgi:flagellar hook-length control protein FliK
MRSQLYSADAIARLAAQPLPRPSNRIDKPSGGFDSMLKEARSAREASRRKVERSEGPAKNESAPEDQPAGDENPAPVVQDDAATRPQSGTDAAPESKTGADAAPAAAPQGTTPSGQSVQNEQQNADASEAAKPVVQPVAQVVPPNVAELGEATDGTTPDGPHGGTLQLVTEGLESNPKPIRPAPATAVPRGEDAAVVSQAVADRASAEAAKKQNNPQGAGSDQVVSESSDRQESSSPAIRPMPVGRRPENQKEPPKPASSDTPVKDDARPRIGHESVQQLKVDASLAERKAGRSDLETGEPRHSEAAATKSGNTQPAANRVRPIAPAADPIESAAPTGFRIIAGDSTAASIARFLITPASDSGGSAAAVPAAANATGSASSSPMPAAGPRASQPIAGSSAAVASNILSSGSNAPAGIDATARVLSASNGEGRYQVTLQLDPPDLGQLRVQVRMEQHVMTMQVDADTAASAKLIESRLSDLRDALSAHGIRMDRNDVVVRSPASSDANPQNQDSGQNGTGQHNRGEAGGAGGWLSDGRQAAGSQEHGSSGHGPAGDYTQISDPDSSAAVVDDLRAAVDLISTTELSLNLVA